MAGAVYYAYDLSGMKQEVKDADERPNYHVYDAAGRLDRVVLDNSRAAYYHYDASGMVTTKLLPDNRVMSYFAYDEAGRLAQLTHCDDTGAPIAYFAYQRNANGTPVWIRREGGLNQYYEYDALNRLTLDQLNSSSATVYGFRYAYDAASNRSIKTDTVAARATYYTNDARNLLTKEFVLQTGATNYFDHDASRRMTVQRSSTEARYFAYDQGARPTQIRHAAGSPDAIHYFSYNGAGERVRVAEGSTEAYWSYDGSKLIRERRSDDTFGTFRVYRHNKSAADGFGTVLEVESQGFLKESPAQSPPCGKTTRLTGKIDDVVPAVAYYEYDAFGVRQGVSATSGGMDTAQRLQFGGNALVRLVTTPSFYLTKSGLYVAEQDMIVGGSAASADILTPFVPVEDGGGDADDPRDECPPKFYGEEIEPAVGCIAGEPIFRLVGDTIGQLDPLATDTLTGRPPYSAFVRATRLSASAFQGRLMPIHEEPISARKTGPYLVHYSDGWAAQHLFFVELPIRDLDGKSCGFKYQEFPRAFSVGVPDGPSGRHDGDPTDTPVIRQSGIRLDVMRIKYTTPNRFYDEAFLYGDAPAPFIRSLDVSLLRVQEIQQRYTIYDHSIPIMTARMDFLAAFDSAHFDPPCYKAGMVGGAVGLVGATFVPSLPPSNRFSGISPPRLGSHFSC
jgi:YD repeat-containing protein